MGLHGRTVLITGSTNGIGRETAISMAAVGASVLVTGRSTERGEAVVDKIFGAGGNARFIEADLSRSGEIERLAAEAGEVDVLVNNAHSSTFAPTVELTPGDFERTFTMNVQAPYFLAAALLPGMMTRRRGTIINIATMAAYIGLPGTSLYGASKAALSSLTRTWAAEFGEFGIRVHTLSPGPTRTATAYEMLGEEGVELLAKTTLLQRVADPAEIARAIVYLASDDSSYMTGTVMHVDAGRTAV